MRKYAFMFSFLLLISCSRKTPQITYINETKTKTDTIVSFVDGGTDTLYSTVPCDSFTMVIRKTDTIYIRKIQKEVQVKLVTKTDTVFRTPVIVNSGKTVVKTDNSVTAKKGSIIGNDNTMTTKKDNKFWLGVLCTTMFFYLLGFGLMVLQRYVPISMFAVTIIRKFLPNGQ